MIQHDNLYKDRKNEWEMKRIQEQKRETTIRSTESSFDVVV